MYRNNFRPPSVFHQAYWSYKVTNTLTLYQNHWTLTIQPWALLPTSTTKQTNLSHHPAAQAALLVNVAAFFEPLASSPGLRHSLAPSQVDQTHFADFLPRVLIVGKKRETTHMKEYAWILTYLPPQSACDLNQFTVISASKVFSSKQNLDLCMYVHCTCVCMSMFMCVSTKE